MSPSADADREWRRLAGATSICAVLLVLSMMSHPGGHTFAPAAKGHGFWRSFVCDLFAGTTANGRTNVRGSTYAIAATVALLLGLVPL